MAKGYEQMVVDGRNEQEELLERARAWIAHDPDPQTRAELEALIEARRFDELADRMDGSLTFGTAGLRGIVGAGSNRMNRAVVVRTSHGLAGWVREHGGEGALIVIGADARTSSAVFLEDAVAVFLAAGLEVAYLPGSSPTPLVAFAARELGAIAAVVITASHNPPEYNGYKVYGPEHIQIVPPIDREIATRIDAAPPADLVPRVDAPFSHPRARALEEMRSRYLEAASTHLARLEAEPASGAEAHEEARDFPIVYTALHGVGGAYTPALLEGAGFSGVVPVAEQLEPDGCFPTLRFPNPEEPEALALAHERAQKVQAELVLANDPDADRLAVSLPDPRRMGAWRPLSGNQIGVLLADLLLECEREAEARKDGPAPLVINSIVSSPMLGAIAAAHGARWVRTLTGFKWIWSAARALERAGEGRFVFGYEEAIGYSVWPLVRDKDGITAACAFARLVARERARGRSVWQRLEALYRTHGLWVSAQKSIVCPGVRGRRRIEDAMERLEHERPDALASLRVTEATDYRLGAEARPFYLGQASLIELQLGERGRALVRPSGTEPKLKIYVDLQAALEEGEAVFEREERLQREALEVASALARFTGLETE